VVAFAATWFAAIGARRANEWHHQYPTVSSAATGNV